MKVLIVVAHPEIRSLTCSLAKVAREAFEANGDEVQVSDLYRMDWKSQVDRDDFPEYKKDRLQVFDASMEAKSVGLTADVRAEQEKLKWADSLVLVFPLWWFSMPAILKGWVERVFSCGFGYGLGEYTETHWGDRYGEGTFAGKRAMLITCAGGWESHYGARGINGSMEDLLFPIQHGIFFYAGYQVLPPFVVYNTHRIDEAGFAEESRKLQERVRSFGQTEPIKYRVQNGGEYTIPELQLKESLSKVTGLQQHIRS